MGAVHRTCQASLPGLPYIGKACHGPIHAICAGRRRILVRVCSRPWCLAYYPTSVSAGSPPSVSITTSRSLVLVRRVPHDKLGCHRTHSSHSGTILRLCSHFRQRSRVLLEVSKHVACFRSLRHSSLLRPAGLSPSHSGVLRRS